MSDEVWLDVMRLAVILLIAVNGFAVLVGLMLMLTPQHVARWSQMANHWVSTDSFAESLERARDADRYLLNYPRAAGILLIGGAGLLILHGGSFVARTGVGNGGLLLADLFGRGDPVFWEAVWITASTAVGLGAAAALALGLLALVNANLLRQLSGLVNRWVSTRESSDVLDTPHYAVDGLVQQFPRLWGLSISLLTVYTLVLLIGFLQRL